MACTKGHRGHNGVQRLLVGVLVVAWKGHERAAAINGCAKSCRRGYVGWCGQGREGHRGAPDPRRNRRFFVNLPNVVVSVGQLAGYNDPARVVRPVSLPPQ